MRPWLRGANTVRTKAVGQRHWQRSYLGEGGVGRSIESKLNKLSWKARELIDRNSFQMTSSFNFLFSYNLLEESLKFQCYSTILEASINKNCIFIWNSINRNCIGRWLNSRVTHVIGSLPQTGSLSPPSLSASGRVVSSPHPVSALRRGSLLLLPAVRAIPAVSVGSDLRWVI